MFFFSVISFPLVLFCAFVIIALFVEFFIIKVYFSTFFVYLQWESQLLFVHFICLKLYLLGTNCYKFFLNQDFLRSGIFHLLSLFTVNALYKLLDPEFCEYSFPYFTVIFLFFKFAALADLTFFIFCHVLVSISNLCYFTDCLLMRQLKL